MLSNALQSYKEEQGRYPTTQEGLAFLARKDVYYIKKVPKDPWGNPFFYRSPGVHNPDSYDLWTNGADGQSGGEGLYADCGNWHGGDCYLKPINYKVWFLAIALLLSSPLCWGILYISKTLSRMSNGQKLSRAAIGTQSIFLLVTFPLFIILAFVTTPFFSLC